MYRRTSPSPWLLVAAALLIGLLLGVLVVPGFRMALAAHPGLLAALLLASVGWLLVAWRQRRGLVATGDDLSASELTTLTFPPERRLHRSHVASRH